MKGLGIVVTLALAGCASSGIVSGEKDTYLISKVSTACGFGSPEALKTDLYLEAAEHCSASRPGSKIETVEWLGSNGVPFVRCASATLNFRCKAE